MVQKVVNSDFPWKVQMRNHEGKVVTKSFSKKDDAERFEEKLRRERQLVRAGLEAPKSEILIHDFFANWMRTRIKEVPRSTWEMDDCRYRNHVAEKFGTRPMQTVSSAEWKEHFDSLIHEKGLSKATRNRIRALMHKLYQDAFMADKVVFNPISKIPLLEEPIKRRRVIWDATQYESYIRAAYEISPYAGLFAEISLFEGTRISETLALQIGDIDHDAGCIWITKIYEQESHEICDRTKGDEMGRAVPLFPRVKDAIERHLRIHPYKGRNAYLFAQGTGHPIDPYTARRMHHAAVDAARLPRITPHGLRHVFASIAEMAGFTSAELKDVLGHSTIQMTERYTHMQMKHLINKGQSIGFGAAQNNVSRLRGKK